MHTSITPPFITINWRELLTVLDKWIMRGTWIWIDWIYMWSLSERTGGWEKSVLNIAFSWMRAPCWGWHGGSDGMCIALPFILIPHHSILYEMTRREEAFWICLHCITLRHHYHHLQKKYSTLFLCWRCDMLCVLYTKPR